jgi:hypothetical protein
MRKLRSYFFWTQRHKNWLLLILQKIYKKIDKFLFLMYNIIDTADLNTITG